MTDHEHHIRFGWPMPREHFRLGTLVNLDDASWDVVNEVIRLIGRTMMLDGRGCPQLEQWGGCRGDGVQEDCIMIRAPCGCSVAVTLKKGRLTWPC